ncbi:MAG TPA: HlyD family secretion protein, partial [Spirochaetia bacterium]|nr:HlyD family secretion protein [Spirochaetia bacterium]
MQRKTIIILAVVVIALGVVGFIGYFDYQNRNFVSTDDARVAADVATVSPQIAGNLISWNTSEGAAVQAGQVLGRQDLGDALQSGALSPQSLTAVGGVMAEKALLRAPITGEIIKSN